jgi:hypothetical protein
MKGKVCILLLVLVLALTGCSSDEGNLITGNTVLDTPEEPTEPTTDDGTVQVSGGTVQRVDFIEGEEK